MQAQGFSLAKLPDELLNTPYIFAMYPESESSSSRKEQIFFIFPRDISRFLYLQLLPVAVRWYGT
jgi:hypothetical protein